MNVHDLSLFLVQSIAIYVIYKLKIRNKIKLFVMSLFFIEYTTILLIFGNKLSTGLNFILVCFTAFLLSKIVSQFKFKTNSLIPSGKNSRFEFLVGFLIIFLTLSSEFLFFDRQISFLTQFAILSGFSWIFRSRISSSDEFFSNFLFIFLNLCFLCLAIPFLYYKLNMLFFDESNLLISEEDIIYRLLTVPLGNALGLLFDWSYFDPNYKDTIFFYDTTRNVTSSVSISKGCTGIYSVLIFTCALFSYAFVKHDGLDLSFAVVASLGILIAYISNIIRMGTIIFIGHKYGYEMLEFSHSHLGWIFFLVWSMAFWYLYEKYSFITAGEAYKRG